jgi:hypothetical protein
MIPRTPDTPTIIAPSLGQLARTTAVALVVAAVLLLAFVLPAEYAMDPLGSGRWLGLTEIAAPPVNSVDEFPTGGALKPRAKGTLGEYPSEFKLDVYDVTLEPYEYVEYKYHLEEGATLLYAWKASAPVVQDFHGERDSSANGAVSEESFDKADRREAAGSLTAPFTGIHGWYWENTSTAPVTIRLTSSGFYSSAVEIRSDRSRHQRPLQSLDVLNGRPSETAATPQ